MANLSGKQKASIGTVAAAIIAAVIGVEGGYVNNPRDPGGETNHGVTVAVAREAGYQGPMSQMTQEDAAEIYHEKYLANPSFDRFLTLSPALTEKLVDAGVNTGPARPAKWLQQSLNSVNRDGKDFNQIAEDGQIGNGTVNAYVSLVRVRGKFNACAMMIKAIDARQGMYYMNLTNLRTFTPGWIINRIGNVPISRCDE